MGQSQSTVREEEYAKKKEDWLRPIESREQLLNRYQDVLGTICLSFEERSWLEIVFEKFASSPGYWSESDLTSFFSLSFPEPSPQLLRDAGPTLYRLILRVGSYPYQQDPVKGLDLGTLRTAIIILLRNDEYKLCTTDVDGRGHEHAAQLQARYLRLLFQSLAPTPDLNTDEKAASDDEDIVEALCVISKRKSLRHPTNPKIGTPAPALPLPSSLPSSHAKALEGRLFRADLQVLIRLFLACQLYWGGSGPEHVIVSPPDGFNKASDSILSAFNLDQDGGCRWRDFDRVMATQKPGLHVAMPRILETLTKKSRTLDKDGFASLSKAEATKLLQSEYKSTESKFPAPGVILNLPLLCQLTMFLPEDLPLDKAKLVASKKRELKTAQAFKTHIERPSSGSLLLVSGNTHGETAVSPSGEQTVCGVYMPPEDSASVNNARRPVVFQCQPKQCVWLGSINREQSSLRGNLVTDDLVLRVDATLETYAELHVDFQLREGSLSLPIDEKSDARDTLHFSVSDLEVFVVTPDVN